MFIQYYLNKVNDLILQLAQTPLSSAPMVFVLLIDHREFGENRRVVAAVIFKHKASNAQFNSIETKQTKL